MAGDQAWPPRTRMAAGLGAIVVAQERGSIRRRSDDCVTAGQGVGYWRTLAAR
jgi:hypothetical protein